MTRVKTGDVLDYTLLKRVLAFAKPYRLQFIIASVAAVSLSFLGPIRPMLINYAVDSYIIPSDKEGLLNIIALLFFLLFLEGVIQFFYILKWNQFILLTINYHSRSWTWR